MKANQANQSPCRIVTEVNDTLDTSRGSTIEQLCLGHKVPTLQTIGRVFNDFLKADSHAVEINQWDRSGLGQVQASLNSAKNKLSTMPSIVSEIELAGDCWLAISRAQQTIDLLLEHYSLACDTQDITKDNHVVLIQEQQEDNKGYLANTCFYTTTNTIKDCIE